MQSNLIWILMIVLLPYTTASYVPGAESKEFRVTDYGAKGDGKHDDTLAIKKTIMAAASGGLVLFPATGKSYLITDSIELNVSNLQIDGNGATLYLKDGSATGRILPEKWLHVIKVGGSVDAPVENIAIRNITIDANYWGQSGTSVSWQVSASIAGHPRGIFLTHARNVVVENVIIRRPFVGITLGLGSHNCEVRDTVVTQWHHDGFGVTPERVDRGASNILFLRCQAKDSLNGAQGGLPGTRQDSWEIEEGAQDVKLIDCVVKNTGADGFFVRPHWTKTQNKYHTGNVDLIRCRVENAGRSAFLIMGYDHLQTVSGVRLKDCYADKGCLSIVMNPGEIEVEGGRFGEMTIGYYMDYDDDHHVKNGAWNDIFDHLPARSVTIKNTEINGDVRINAIEGSDGKNFYSPDITLSRVEIEGDLYIVGSKSMVKTEKCRIAGAERNVTPSEYFQALENDSRIELSSGKVIHCAVAPQIDGYGNDACWQSAESHDMMYDAFHRRRNKAGHSSVRVCYDEQALYVLMDCLESNMDGLKTEAKQRDEDLWYDDCVEIFIHRSSDSQNYFRQWMVNASGVLYDGDKTIAEKWNSSVTVSVRRLSDRYVVESAIPWIDIGGKVKPNEEIKANFVRNCATEGARWIWSWRYDGTVAFGDTSKMGTLTFE